MSRFQPNHLRRHILPTRSSARAVEKALHAGTSWEVTLWAYDPRIYPGCSGSTNARGNPAWGAFAHRLGLAALRGRAPGRAPGAGSSRRDARGLEAADVGVAGQQEVQLVLTVHQAIAREGVDGERDLG